MPHDAAFSAAADKPRDAAITPYATPCRHYAALYGYVATPFTLPPLRATLMPLTPSLRRQEVYARRRSDDAFLLMITLPMPMPPSHYADYRAYGRLPMPPW